MTPCPICAWRLERLAQQARALSELIAAWDQDEDLPVAVEELGRFAENVADEIEHSCHFTGKGPPWLRSGTVNGF